MRTILALVLLALALGGLWAARGWFAPRAGPAIEATAKARSTGDSEGEPALASPPSASSAEQSPHSPEGRPELGARTAVIEPTADPPPSIVVGQLPLKRGVVVAGRVVGPGGGGVADATVYLSRVDDDEPVLFGIDIAALAEQLDEGALTDADGCFAFPPEPPGTFDVRATHPRFVHAHERVALAEVGESAELVLELGLGAAIAGRVHGLPPEHDPRRFAVTLRAGSADDSAPGRIAFDIRSALENAGFSRGERALALAADGQFRLEGLQPETAYELWLLEEPHEAAEDPEDQIRGTFGWRRCSALVEARAGDTGVRLGYDPGTTLTFTVVDAVSGAPVEELRIATEWDRGPNYWNAPRDAGGARTFADGRVELTHLRPPEGSDRLRLVVEALGYAPDERALAVAGAPALELGTIALTPVPIVTVFATDSSLEASAGANPRTSNGARTEAPVPGALVTLTIEEAPEYGAEAVASGRSITFSTRVSTSSGPAPAPPPAQGAQAVASARTDANGRARLSSVPGRRAAIRVMSPRHAPWERIVELGSDPLVLRAELVGGGAVAVAVVDARDRPLEGITVEQRGGGTERSGVTDARGRALFQQLAPGEHAFRIRIEPADGVSVFSVRVDGVEESGWTAIAVEDGRTHALQLVEPLRGALAGTVRENGAPLVGATLSLVRGFDAADLPGGAADAGPFPAELSSELEGLLALAGPRTRTDEDGRYRFDNLIVGAYRLRVEHVDRALPTAVDVEVTEGETDEDIALASGIVRGRVVDGAGRPIASARVEAAPANALAADGELAAARSMLGQFGATATQSARSDGDGWFELRGLPVASSFAVLASNASSVHAKSGPLTLDAGETRELEPLTLIAAGRIRVELESHGDVELPPTVTAYYLGSEPTDAAGEFVRNGRALLRNLRPGPWRVSAGDREERVEVRAGETSELVWTF